MKDFIAYIKWTLEKTEVAIINGQSRPRETDNIEYTKTKKKTQHNFRPVKPFVKIIPPTELL
jgi:hypothetical protein